SVNQSSLQGGKGALFVLFNRLWNKNTTLKLSHALSVLITFIVVSLLWVCFRAEQSADIAVLYSSLFTDIHLTRSSVSIAILPLTGDRNSIDHFLIDLLVLVPLIIYESGVLNANRYKKVYTSPITWAAIILMILLLGESGTHNFIYFQF
ncbi:MAG: hypothetical protein ACHQFW_11610, partial [Chitinophagales bacterium]